METVSNSFLIFGSKKIIMITNSYTASRQVKAMMEAKRGKGITYKSLIISKILVLSDIKE